MSIGVVARMSLGQSQHMLSTWVGESCHGAVRSKTIQQCQLWLLIVYLVTVQTKSIVIRYIYTKKVIMFPLLNLFLVIRSKLIC